MTKQSLLERPTRQQIALLPPFAGLSLDQIVVLRTPAQLEDAYRAIEREGVVGFDTESKPTFTKGAEATGPHVVQFALRDRAFIVQLGKEPPLGFLKSVLESRSIAKVGFGLNSDKGSLFRKLGVTVAAAVDLTGPLRALRYKQALGAKAAVAIVLGQRLQKSKSVTTSNWASAALTPKQLLYAANDAYAALCVFLALGSPRAAGESPAPDPSIERTPTGKRRLPAGSPVPVIRPLRDVEYTAWKRESVLAYARDKVESGAWDDSDAVEKATQEFEALLPLGLNTKDNHLFAVLASDGTHVGVLWFAVKDRAKARIAYIYNIEIFRGHRRRGHARQALAALEEEVRRLGLQGIALHVFGHNTAAQALYTKLGYAPTNINMYKDVRTGA